jgi:hypothetical protein
MFDDLRLCDNCGMSLLGCDLFKGGTGRDCCTQCKHPEPKRPKEDESPLMRREEMVN